MSKKMISGEWVHKRQGGAIGRTMLACGVVLFLCLLFVSPGRAMKGAEKGLLLWYQIVLPSQLPFVAGVKLLLKLQSFQAGPPVLMNFLIGLVSGYPVGTMTTAHFYRTGRISPRSLTPLAAFTNMAGPLFVVGTVGAGLLGDARWGYYLLMVHWVSAGLLVLFPALRERHAGRARVTGALAVERSSIGRLMGDAVGETAELMLKVGGFIVLFSVLRQWVGGPVGAVLEMTGGIRWVVQQGWSLKWTLTVCSFLINFSGVCILMQSLGCAEGVPVSTAGFLGSKLGQGLLAAALMLGICQFLGM